MCFYLSEFIYPAPELSEANSKSGTYIYQYYYYVLGGTYTHAAGQAACQAGGGDLAAFFDMGQPFQQVQSFLLEKVG